MWVRGLFLDLFGFGLRKIVLVVLFHGGLAGCVFKCFLTCAAWQFRRVVFHLSFLTAIRVTKCAVCRGGVGQGICCMLVWQGFPIDVWHAQFGRSCGSFEHPSIPIAIHVTEAGILLFRSCSFVVMCVVFWRDYI